MGPERGRASKACAACRKQKTRCYDAGTGTRKCLRCQTLRLSCSLSEEVDQDALAHANSRGKKAPSSSSYDDRLVLLEKTVAALIARLDNAPAGVQAIRQSPTNPEASAILDRGLRASSPAPIMLLRNVAAEVGVSPENHQLDDTTRIGNAVDIIGRGALNAEEAVSLVKLFQEHYGRWISLNTTIDPKRLVAHLRRSPLLLCACSLIAVRHTSIESARRLADPLFQETKSLLNATILTITDSIDFFRAAVVLSFWSTTVGRSPLSLDSWLLSGFALQQSFASDVFRLSSGAIGGTPKSREELDRLCIWNHLCLTHLHYSVGTHRSSVIQRSHIERCRLILDSDHATNFETRIVAEVFLYWTIYENCCVHSVDLPKTQSALHAWKLEWQYLFEQPRSTFLQMGLNFAQLMAYDRSLKSRSAAVRESLLSEMVRLSSTIITLAMETTDDRTRHLSDHIYHLITFAAVTICRLLHMYESQLAASHDLGDLDNTVLMLANWLHSIGPDCHIAHTFGDVVAAFHKKLRPDAQPTSPTLSYQEAEPVIDAEFARLFPDLFSSNMFDGPTPQLLPDREGATPGFA